MHPTPSSVSLSLSLVSLSSHHLRLPVVSSSPAQLMPYHPLPGAEATLVTPAYPYIIHHTSGNNAMNKLGGGGARLASPSLQTNKTLF